MQLCLFLPDQWTLGMGLDTKSASSGSVPTKGLMKMKIISSLKWRKSLQEEKMGETVLSALRSQVGLMPSCQSPSGLVAVNSLHTWWIDRLIRKKLIFFQRHPSKKVGVIQALGGACFSPLTLCAISVQAQAYPTDYYTFRWILGKMNPTTSFASALLMQLFCFSQGKMWCSSCCVKADVFSCFLF